MRTQVALRDVGPLVHGHHEDPFELLGPHEVVEDGRKALAVRAFLPDIQQAWVVDPANGRTRPMRRLHPAGLYEAICPGTEDELRRRYQLRVADKHGERTTVRDAYAFPSMLTDYDLYLLGEGTHWKSYERMGAHLRTVDGVEGVHFVVWAPNASGVSVRL